jgi:hypothetical protein
VAPGERALERDEHQRDEHRLGVADRRVAHEPAGQHDRRGRQQRGPPWRAEATGHDERERHRHHRRRARHDEPQLGRRVAERRQQGGHGDREGLPGGPVGGRQRALPQLAPPQKPRPGVVAWRRRHQERRRRDRKRRRRKASVRKGGDPALN